MRANIIKYDDGLLGLEIHASNVADQVCLKQIVEGYPRMRLVTVDKNDRCYRLEHDCPNNDVQFTPTDLTANRPPISN